MTSRWSDSDAGARVDQERSNDGDHRRIPKRTREHESNYSDRNQRPRDNSHRDRRPYNTNRDHNHNHRNPPLHRRLDVIEERLDEVIKQNIDLHKLLQEVHKSTSDLRASCDLDTTELDTDDKTPCPEGDDNW